MIRDAKKAKRPENAPFPAAVKNIAQTPSSSATPEVADNKMETKEVREETEVIKMQQGGENESQDVTKITEEKESS